MSSTDETQKALTEARLPPYVERVIQALIIGCLMWVGVTLNSVQTGFATLTERISAVQNDVSRLEALANDRYTESSAQREHDRIDREVEDIKKRLRDVETAN